MKKYFNIFLTIFLFTSFFSQTIKAQVPDSLSDISEQNITLNAYVESSRVPLNGMVVLHIEVSWPGKLSQYQIAPVSQPILTNLLLEGSGSENRLITGDDGEPHSLKAITYRLRPLEMGMAYIDGIVVKYEDRQNGLEDNLSTQRIMVEILEAIPENGDSTFKSLIYIILLILFFVIMFYFIIKYFRKKKVSEHEDKTAISVAEKYLQQLSQKVDPRGTNLDEMTQRLSRIFREYIHRDFNIPAKELSTNEILLQVKELDLQETDKEILSTVFKKLDEIKFTGKLIDPNEFTSVYGSIEEFLLRRKQEFESSRYSTKEEK
jgi:hypothetical protein